MLLNIPLLFSHYPKRKIMAVTLAVVFVLFVGLFVFRSSIFKADTGPYALSGKIFAQDSKTPLSDVNIILSTTDLGVPSVVAKSNPDGSYSVFAPANTFTSISFTKDGYWDLEGAVVNSGNLSVMTLNLAMKPGFGKEDIEITTVKKGKSWETVRFGLSLNPTDDSPSSLKTIVPDGTTYKEQSLGLLIKGYDLSKHDFMSQTSYPTQANTIGKLPFVASSESNAAYSPDTDKYYLFGGPNPGDNHIYEYDRNFPNDLNQITDLPFAGPSLASIYVPEIKAILIFPRAGYISAYQPQSNKLIQISQFVDLNSTRLNVFRGQNILYVLKENDLSVRPTTQSELSILNIADLKVNFDSPCDANSCQANLQDTGIKIPRISTMPYYKSDGFIYFLGGNENGVIQDTIIQVDPKDATKTTVLDQNHKMSTPLAYSAYQREDSGKRMYLFGGVTDANNTPYKKTLTFYADGTGLPRAGEEDFKPTFTDPIINAPFVQDNSNRTLIFNQNVQKISGSLTLFAGETLEIGASKDATILFRGRAKTDAFSFTNKTIQETNWQNYGPTYFANPYAEAVPLFAIQIKYQDKNYSFKEAVDSNIINSSILISNYPGQKQLDLSNPNLSIPPGAYFAFWGKKDGLNVAIIFNNLKKDSIELPMPLTDDDIRIINTKQEELSSDQRNRYQKLMGDIIAFCIDSTQSSYNDLIESGEKFDISLHVTKNGKLLSSIASQAVNISDSSSNFIQQAKAAESASMAISFEKFSGDIHGEHVETTEWNQQLVDLYKNFYEEKVYSELLKYQGAPVPISSKDSDSANQFVRVAWIDGTYSAPTRYIPDINLIILTHTKSEMLGWQGKESFIHELSHRWRGEEGFEPWLEEGLAVFVTRKIAQDIGMSMAVPFISMTNYEQYNRAPDDSFYSMNTIRVGARYDLAELKVRKMSYEYTDVAQRLQKYLHDTPSDKICDSVQCDGFDQVFQNGLEGLKGSEWYGINSFGYGRGVFGVNGFKNISDYPLIKYQRNSSTKETFIGGAYHIWNNGLPFKSTSSILNIRQKNNEFTNPIKINDWENWSTRDLLSLNEFTDPLETLWVQPIFYRDDYADPSYKLSFGSPVFINKPQMDKSYFIGTVDAISSGEAKITRIKPSLLPTKTTAISNGMFSFGLDDKEYGGVQGTYNFEFSSPNGCVIKRTVTRGPESDGPYILPVYSEYENDVSDACSIKPETKLQDITMSGQSTTLRFSTNLPTVSFLRWKKEQDKYSTIPADDTLVDNSTVKTHEFKLNMLKAGEKYSYQINVVTTNGKSERVNGEFEFNPIDITNIAIKDITNNSATITWTTDPATQGVIEYGTGTSYGQTKADTEVKTDHSVALTNLVKDATYHFRIKAFISDPAKSNYSSDQTFKATPLVISVTTGMYGEDLSISYGISQSVYNYLTFNGQKYGDGVKATNSNYFVIPSSDLTPLTEYSYSIKAYLNKDNESGAVTSDGKYTWNPCGLHNYSWRTDSELYFYLDKQYSAVELTIGGVTHQLNTFQNYPKSGGYANFGIRISDWGLQNGTTYSYSVRAFTVGQGYTSCDIPRSVTTFGSAQGPAAPAAIVSAQSYLPQEIKQDDVNGTLFYQTTLPVTTQIEYGARANEYTNTLTVEDKATTIHIPRISNLKARTYHYRIVSTDAQGKKYYSKDQVLKHGTPIKRFFGDIWEKISQLIKGKIK